MAYYDVSLLAVDQDFRARIAACASTEGLPEKMHPIYFADQFQWEIAGAPGFGDAYASALAADVERPGADPSVISDAQILSVVQPIIAELDVEDVPEPPVV